MAERNRRIGVKRVRFFSNFRQELIRNLYEYKRYYIQLLVAVIVDMVAFRCLSAKGFEHVNEG
ncbi:MAG: hypothetical protein JRI46_05945 [Deltaproteobacteria bacterium]|nr:hypothetical protein [Deltaproteobacteria bacterium]